MELLQELLLTAFLSLLVSVLVVKLVSIAVKNANDDDQRRNKSSEIVGSETVMEEDLLKVGATAESEKKVQVFVDQFVGEVDQFEDRGEPGDNLEELVDLEGVCDGAGKIEAVDKSGEVSGEVGLPVKLPELTSEEPGEFRSEGGEEENEESGLIVEQVREGTKADDSLVVGEDVDDQTKPVRKMEIGENSGSEIERSNDYQTEVVRIMEIGLDQRSGIEMIDDIVDDQTESIGIMEIGEDQRSGTARSDDLVDDQNEPVRVMEIGVNELNGIEKSDDIVDNQTEPVRVMEIGVNELNGIERSDDVDDQIELVRIMTIGKDQGSGTERSHYIVYDQPEPVMSMEIRANQGSGIETSDNIVDDHTEPCTIVEIGEDRGSETKEEVNEWERKEKGLICNDDDDWEGIERTELEKVFATAAGFAKDDNLLNLGRDIQMQLYGLHKVAMEGPCHEAQPMALKVSARAKWNAWQRLGNMSPEVAMEQYINLLSDKVPGWSQREYSAGDDNSANTDFSDFGITSILDISPKESRKQEVQSSFAGGDLTGSSNSVNQDKE